MSTVSVLFALSILLLLSRVTKKVIFRPAYSSSYIKILLKVVQKKVFVRKKNRKPSKYAGLRSKVIIGVTRFEVDTESPENAVKKGGSGIPG